MRYLLARIQVGEHVEEIRIEDRPRGDGTVPRTRYERQPDGFVQVYRDHVRTHPDGTEEVVDTFRPARWSPDQLLSIAICEE